MLSLSKHWLTQNSFDSLYHFGKVNQSPLISNLCSDRIRFASKISLSDKLSIAIKNGFLHIVQYLADHEADIHEYNDSALYLALECRYEEII